MNEKIPAISVIIPMFNAEKYIEQCLDSIADQTFEDYEVIVVDDCSTDRSVALTEAFYERKIGGRSQFHLLKLPENSGGASIPRNQALKLARGKYVTFVDSDDLLIDNALEILFNVAEKFQADVVDAEKFFVRRDGFGINTNSGMTVTSWQTAPFVNKPTLETNDIDERVVAFCQRRFFRQIFHLPPDHTSHTISECSYRTSVVRRTCFADPFVRICSVEKIGFRPQLH